MRSEFRQHFNGEPARVHLTWKIAFVVREFREHRLSQSEFGRCSGGRIRWERQIIFEGYFGSAREREYVYGKRYRQLIDFLGSE